MSPRVSIGMPVYNGERYLRESLDALLAQTFQDFELIISDNASTDETEAICRAYAARDARIRYFRNATNLGAAHNYNRVFELSTAPYFKWAASDDLCAPECLACCVEALDREPAAVLAYPKTKIIDEYGTMLCVYDDHMHLQSARPSARLKHLMQALGECNAVFGLIRSDILRRTPLIGRYPGSDICLLAELSLYGKFWEIPEFLFFRRNHPAASSSDKSIEKQMEFFDPTDKALVRLTKWRHCFEDARSIWRVPLSFPEKARAGAFLFRFAIWNRKKLASELWFATQQLAHKLFFSSARNSESTER